MLKKENRRYLLKNKNIFLYPSGFAGMALYFHNLATALQENGAKATLFAYKNYELDNLSIKYSLRKILSTGSLSYVHQQSTLGKIVRIVKARVYNLFLFYRAVLKEKPIVAHIQELFYPLDWILYYLISKTPSLLVFTIHDVLPHTFYTKHFTRVEKKILGFIYSRADQLIVHSKTNQRQLLTLFPINPEKVTVIPHGQYSQKAFTPLAFSKEEAKKKFGLYSEGKIILFFGHIRKDKGLDILLRAFQGVIKKKPQTYLIIAGLPLQGESFENYNRLIYKLGIEQNVLYFIQYIPTEHIPRFFLPADIVCLPYTRVFSQSGVLHLAQGFGKAVVVTNVGGMAEVVQHASTGLVVPPKNSHKLQEALLYLLENPYLCRKMGQEALKKSNKEYSWQNIAVNTLIKAYHLSR